MTAVLTPEMVAPPVRRPVVARALEFLAQPRRALLAAVLLAVGSVGFDALSDPDVWWHMRLGDWILAGHRIPTTELFSYTAQGNPLTAHEWLSDTVFALLNGGGGLLLVALFVGVACWSGFVAIAIRAAQRGAGPIAMALGLALGAKAAEPVLGTRPQVFTFVLLCWTLWLADSYLRKGGRRIWLLPAVFLLWANLHAGFIAGLGVLVLVVLGEVIKRWLHSPAAATRERLRVLLLCIGASALAACVNPSGPSLYHFALTVSTTEGQKGIVEWLSPNFHDPGMWALLALIVSLAVMPALGARPDVRDALLAAAGVALALTAVRETAICVALVTPLWIAMAADVGRSSKERRLRAATSGALRRPPRVSPLACALGGIVVLAGGSAVSAAVARTAAQTQAAGIASAYPACATAVLARSPVAQRIFVVYAGAGYVINRLYPNGRVYEYGESISLGFTVFRDYERIAAGTRTSPSSLQLLTDSGTTAVLYPRGELTGELDATPGWTRVLADPAGVLLYLKGDASWTVGATCPSAGATKAP